MYMAFVTRASQGDTDNSEIIEEIRQLRYFDIHYTGLASLLLHFLWEQGNGNKAYQSEVL